MRASSVMGCAFLASSLISQIAGCAASRPVGGTESSRAAAVQGKNGIEAPSQTHEPSSGANAEPCAMGWMQIAGGVCVRFSKLEQGDDPRGKLIAMDLLSRTGYVHLNLRISVFRGAEMVRVPRRSFALSDRTEPPVRIQGALLHVRCSRRQRGTSAGCRGR